MDKARKQLTVNGAAKAADPMQKTASNPLAPPFIPAERKQDPRETAQEAVHQVTLRSSLDESVATHAADAKWKQQVGAARITWGRLSGDELLKTAGDAQALAGLVQERYAVTRDDADTQVRKFLDTHES